MAITIDDKQQIRQQLIKYCERFTNKHKAANTLTNVSGTTIYSIINEKFDNISDELWRSIRTQIGVADPAKSWNVVETGTVNDLYFCYTDAQESLSFTWAIAPAGSGKTISAKTYQRNNKNVLYVLCDEDMKKKDFAIALAKATGIRVNTQKKARDIFMDAVQEIAEMEDPLIIMDEADKLTDNILYYFITLYNYLHDKAGVVLQSTPYMKVRMATGLDRSRKGYEEIYSRMCRKFFEVEVPTAVDVYGICVANGITDQKTISAVIKDGESCNFDLRRVNRKIRAIKKKQQLTA